MKPIAWENKDSQRPLSLSWPQVNSLHCHPEQQEVQSAKGTEGSKNQGQGSVLNVYYIKVRKTAHPGSTLAPEGGRLHGMFSLTGSPSPSNPPNLYPHTQKGSRPVGSRLDRRLQLSLATTFRRLKPGFDGSHRCLQCGLGNRRSQRSKPRW